jgi:ribulose-bisphosphate carboxylase large chain
MVNKRFPFIQLEYKPKKTDVVCLFRIKPKGIDIKEAANKIALESSIGTWDKVEGFNNELIKKLGAKVFSIKKDFVKIAYPIKIFELGNMPSILSGIAGNIFGMKEIKELRLEDVRFPKKIVKSFHGPKYGIKGVRKMLKIKKRPLVGTIVKPKLGLTPKQHAKYAYDAWKGGLDLVKSDENLTNQSFNKFKTRFVLTIKAMKKAEKETGEKKIYVENVTAETEEMIKRTKFVQENGGNCVMIDIITTGWGAFQTLRNENLNLIIHAHRAGHGMFTENPKHGMSMEVVAQLARMVGADNLHIGAIFGKMKGEKEEVLHIRKEIESQFTKQTKKNLSQQWYGMKPTFAVCSGGIHAGVLQRLVRVIGKDIIAQAGGGVGAHPLGIEAGAKSMRQAVEAIMEGIDLKEYAKTHKELRLAIEKWGYLK